MRWRQQGHVLAKPMTAPERPSAVLASRAETGDLNIDTLLWAAALVTVACVLLVLASAFPTLARLTHI
jgi:hypothetical protein